MKLLPKFALLSLGVAAIPLGIAGVSSFRISRDSLFEAIRSHERLVADQGAEFVSVHLEHLRGTLLAEGRVLDRSHARASLGKDAVVLAKFLQLIYHQNDDFSAVLAVNDKGVPLATPSFQIHPRPGATLGHHEPFGPQDLAIASAHIPISQALADGFAVGSVFSAGRPSVAHVILAMRHEGLPDDPPAVVAVAVSLRRLAQYAASLSQSDRDVVLLDGEAREIASGRSIGPPTLLPRLLPGANKGALPRQDWTGIYESKGRRVISAYSPVHDFPMGVVIERAEASALAPIRRLGWATLYWIGVSGAVAAAVGSVFARSVSKRVRALADGSRAIAQGRLDTRLPIPSNDEFGDLVRAFNAMTTSLEAARTELRRQTTEITSWNETLEKRVEEKTLELRDAQEMLLRSRSLATIGSLGAGVAHEINNPLAGVLGLAQLLASDLPSDHPAAPLVRDIEVQALRISGIVANLLRLSQQQSGEDFRPLDLGDVVSDALELLGAATLADAGIEIIRNIATPSPPIRGSAAQLQTVLVHLIQNARTAMPAGGKLVLESSRPEENVLRLRVTDSGRGIDAELLPRIFDPFVSTRDHGSATGTGLSVVHKIVEDHGGTVRAQSVLGQGTTMWLTFPIDVSAGLLS